MKKYWNIEVFQYFFNNIETISFNLSIFLKYWKTFNISIFSIFHQNIEKQVQYFQSFNISAKYWNSLSWEMGSQGEDAKALGAHEKRLPCFFSEPAAFDFYTTFFNFLSIDFHGFASNSDRCPLIFIDFHWMSFDFDGFALNSDRYLLISLISIRFLLIFMDLHWILIDINWFSLISIGFHWFSWICIEF